MEDQNLLRAQALEIGYATTGKDTSAVAGPINAVLRQGQLVCLLGPNGCGKSTLLRTLSGLQQPLRGTVSLNGENLRSIRPSQIATRISLVLTDNIRAGNLDVYSVIALGRYPYSSWLGGLSAADQAAIDHAVAVTGTAAFLRRSVAALSDGECQKVMLARAIAQDTPIIILDEPTAHLDLPSRIQLMRMLHQLAKNSGKAILMSTHELDLALQAADQIWLMDSAGGFAAGLPEALVLEGAVARAFAREGISFDMASGSFQLYAEGAKEIVLSGEGPAALWTDRALRRLGYAVLLNHLDGEGAALPRAQHFNPDVHKERAIQGQPSVVVKVTGDSYTWTLTRNSRQVQYSSLSDLLQDLS